MLSFQRFDEYKNRPPCPISISARIPPLVIERKRGQSLQQSQSPCRRRILVRRHARASLIHHVRTHCASYRTRGADALCGGRLAFARPNFSRRRIELVYLHAIEADIGDNQVPMSGVKSTIWSRGLRGPSAGGVFVLFEGDRSADLVVNADRYRRHVPRSIVRHREPFSAEGARRQRQEYRLRILPWGGQPARLLRRRAEHHHQSAQITRDLFPVPSRQAGPVQPAFAPSCPRRQDQLRRLP